MKRPPILRNPWLRTEHLLPLATFVVILVSFLVVPGAEGDQLNAGAWSNAFQGFAPLGLVALALGLTLIAGEFDVSVLGMQALGGVLAVRAGGDDGLLGVLAAVGACGFLGCVQGWLIARLRLPSLPVTIGSYVALIGLTNVIANDQTLTYGNIHSSVWVDETLLGWFSPRSLITFGAFALAIVLIGCTKIGPELKALGAERRGARVSGVPVERRIVLLFVVSATLAGLAGALLSYSEASATLDPGLQPLILAIAAAVLGGVSLSGGRGVVWGLLLGSVAVALLEQLFTLIALSAATTQIVFGAMLMAIVSADAPDLTTSLRAFRLRAAQRMKADLSVQRER